MPEVESDYPKFLKLLAGARATQGRYSEASDRKSEAKKAFDAAIEAAVAARAVENEAAEAFCEFLRVRKGRAYIVDGIGYLWKDAVGFDALFIKGMGSVIAFKVTTGESHVPQPEDGPRDS